MKEREDDKNRENDIPCSWMGRINIAKMAILCQTIYRVNTMPIKFPMALFHRTRKKIFNLYGNTKDP